MQQHGISTLQSDKLQFTKDHFMYEDNYAHHVGARLLKYNNSSFSSICLERKEVEKK